MNLFEKELRAMFGSNEMLKDFKCCGNSFIAKLDEDLRVKLRFVTGGVSGHYIGIELKLINRTEGEVDGQIIKFSDVTGLRNIGYDKIEPYIWDYNGKIEWYTPVTAQEELKIAEAISDYISMYQSEGLGLKMQ